MAAHRTTIAAPRLRAIRRFIAIGTAFAKL
jgi:hypothetical protein